ncbi:hypothetical protein ABFX02_14G268800 [Erythranthe guttata]
MAACMKLNSCTLLQTSILCLLAFEFFLLPNLTHVAQARHFSKHFDYTTVKKVRNPETAVKMRAVIGSRPPRCGGRCESCRRCEAVQVPIVPTKKKFHIESSHFYAIEYYRGDDISNYKPMCWKCKCGDFIFNPW